MAPSTSLSSASRLSKQLTPNPLEPLPPPLAYCLLSTHQHPSSNRAHIYSLEVQWLGCHTLIAKDPGSIPGWVTYIPQALQRDQKEKKKRQQVGGHTFNYGTSVLSPLLGRKLPSLPCPRDHKQYLAPERGEKRPGAP